MKRCAVPRDVPKEYRRHEPEKSVLHQVVREHLNTFLELSDVRAGEGQGLPRYVKNAFRSYLECGILAYGFARLRCPDCGYDAVVAFSCKERICRYVVRPPFCQERLRRLDDGRVVYQFRRPWSDGPSPRRSEASASRRREPAPRPGPGGVPGKAGGTDPAAEGAPAPVSRRPGAERQATKSRGSVCRACIRNPRPRPCP